MEVFSVRETQNQIMFLAAPAEETVCRLAEGNPYWTHASSNGEWVASEGINSKIYETGCLMLAWAARSVLILNFLSELDPLWLQSILQ